MKKIILFISFLFSSIVINAQATFQKTFGGSSDDVGNCIQKTSDGGYIIVGATSSFGSGLKDVYYDIGTGFLLGNFHTLVTARHVIESAELITIYNADGQIANAKEIIFSVHKEIDIAIIIISNYVFVSAPPFNAKHGEILEDVMTIGYPPIPGFDAIQIYEKTSINNHFKFSKGQIIAEATAYLDNVDYLLINAKVKGGNSGSPVINKNGNVVGMIVQIPMDSQDASKLDSLGYGIVTPYSEIIKLFPGPTNKPDVKTFDVINTIDGFKISK